MGLLDAYQESTDKALAVMATQPIEPEPPKAKHSAWSAPLRAVAAGASEVLGNVIDTAAAAGQVSAAAGGITPGFDPDATKNRQATVDAYEKLKTEGIDWRTDEGKQAYKFGADLRPDPLTAGAAENIVFGLTKGLTKAVGAAATLGPVAGAAAFGTSEGLTAAEDLANQGVDQETRTKVGLVTAGFNAAGVALPVAGQTLKQTAGLVLAGGPASFMAQQQATRSILENADYGEIAKQYDPLDPTGLIVSTLVPAGFAAYAKRGGLGVKAPQEAIDAAMVQNLTVARDAHGDVTPDRIPEALGDAAPLHEAYGKAASNLVSHLESMGFSTRQESSAISMSQYVYAKTPDYLENDIGEVISGREIKFRLSNHTLPSSYKQADFDVSVQGADDFRPDTGGGIGAALAYASDVSGVKPAGMAESLVSDHLAEVAAKEKVHQEQKTRAANQNVAKLEEYRRFSAWLEDLPESAQIKVSKKGNLSAFVDGAQAKEFGKKPFGFGNASVTAKDAASSTTKELWFLERMYGGAPTPNSASTWSSAPESGMQERTVRAVDPGSSEPAQSLGGAGSESKITPDDVGMQQIKARVDTLIAEQPDLVARLDDAGQPVRLADELSAIKKEAQEGTDTDFGAMDAPLLKVAAECALAIGTAGL